MWGPGFSSGPSQNWQDPKPGKDCIYIFIIYYISIHIYTTISIHTRVNMYATILISAYHNVCVFIALGGYIHIHTRV